MNFSNGKSITFDIWNEAYITRFRTISKIIFKDAIAVILVYDITSKKFREVKNYWYEQVKLYCNKDIFLAVVANKSELYEQSQVEYDAGEKFAKEIGAIFASTSAKKDIGILKCSEYSKK